MAVVDNTIPVTAFKTVTGFFFSLAIIGVITKTAFQLRTQKRVWLEDVFLICACVCLAAGTGVLYALAGSLYGSGNCGLIPDTDVISDGVASDMKISQRYQFAFLTLTWMAIFFVKFSFLFLFKQLVSRIWGMLLFWRFLIALTLISFCICISEPFFSCPKFGTGILECKAPERLALMKRLDVLPITLDILVDVLIVIIPIHLLWKVRIKLNQKIGLGAFLCLNTLMSLVACIRVTGLGLVKPYDLNWSDFWLEIEACVGVLMVSVTAFRTIFVSNISKANRERAARPWYSSTVERLRARKKPDSDDPEMQHFPAIPPATMTGMRTFIAGGRDKTEMSYHQASWNERSLDKHASQSNSSIISVVPMAYRDSPSTYSVTALSSP